MPDTETFTEVLPGSYSVAELLPPGWETMDIVCENDTDNGTVVDLVMAEALIDLDPGEDITCTFFNLDTPLPPVVSSVPTLSEWGVIALVALLGIAGLIAIRRKSALQS